MYPNLQAAKPYPAFGEINVLENRGNAKYNGLQIKLERRFADGLSFTGSYSLAKDTSDTVAADEAGRLQPFVPAGYLSGRCAERPAAHAVVNAVYELPFGRDRRFLNDAASGADAILGGWQLSGINSFVSGAPLSISVPGATLGNGWGTRANVVGRSGRRPTRRSTSGSTRPPSPRRRSSSTATRRIGIIEGPAAHILDLGLMKSFSIGAGAVHPGPGRGLQCAEQGEPGQSGHDARHRELRAHPERRAPRARCSSA